MAASFSLQGPHQPGQPFKFTVTESCDRIKEEFSFLQAQYHRLVTTFSVVLVVPCRVLPPRRLAVHLQIGRLSLARFRCSCASKESLDDAVTPLSSIVLIVLADDMCSECS